MTEIKEALPRLVIDMGTSSVRAAIVSPSLEILHISQRKLGLARLDDSRVEQDGVALISSLWQVVNAAISTGLEFAKATLAIQRSTVIAWNKQSLKPLSPAISWQDVRGRKFVSSLDAHENKIKAISGLVLSPHYGASKIRYLHKKMQPGKEVCVAPLVSFVIANLVVGKSYVCDESNAARTQLFAIEERAWSQTLCDLFEVPLDSLPQLKPTYSHYGVLKQKTLGGREIELESVCGDQNAAFHYLKYAGEAFSQTSGDSVYVNFGTGAFVLAETEGRTIASPLLKSVGSSDCSSLNYLLEGTVNGCGSALDWLYTENACIELSREAFYKKMSELCVTDLSPPIFLNAVGDIASPFWLMGLQSAFLDATTKQVENDFTLELKIKAVLESITFLIYANLLEFENKVGKVRQIVCSGGVLQIEGFPQLLANATGKPVWVSEEKEATVLGAALMLKDRCVEEKEPQGCRQTFFAQADAAIHRRRDVFMALLQEKLK